MNDYETGKIRESRIITVADRKEICELITELTDYGVRSGLVDKDDVTYTINRLLELFGIDEYNADTSKTNGADGSGGKIYDNGTAILTNSMKYLVRCSITPLKKV